MVSNVRELRNVVLPISQFLPFLFGEPSRHMLFQIQTIQQIAIFWRHFDFEDQIKLKQSVDFAQCILGANRNSGKQQQEEKFKSLME